MVVTYVDVYITHMYCMIASSQPTTYRPLFFNYFYRFTLQSWSFLFLFYFLVDFHQSPCCFIIEYRVRVVFSTPFLICLVIVSFCLYFFSFFILCLIYHCHLHTHLYRNVWQNSLLSNFSLFCCNKKVRWST